MARQRLQQVHEDVAAQQFLRVRGLRARRQHGQVGQGGELHHLFQAGATTEDAGQAHLVAQAEVEVLGGVAQVTVDDQGALADLREGHAQVGADEALAVAAVHAGDGQRAAVGRAVEPARHQLAAQAAQRLGERRIGVDRTGDLVGQRQGRSPRRRIAELDGQRLFHVGVGDQAHAHGGLAEAQVGDTLLVEHQVDLVLTQLAVGDQDATHHQGLAVGLIEVGQPGAVIPDQGGASCLAATGVVRGRACRRLVDRVVHVGKMVSEESGETEGVAGHGRQAAGR